MTPPVLGPAWLRAASVAPAAVARLRRVALMALLAYAAVVTLAIPWGIGASWRECDTQSIARNFVLDEFDPLRPRVDWRGDTSGVVECEFPLYQLVIGAVMHVVGLAEWPGRVLSLACVLATAFALHRLLERRCGPAGALAGLLVFLASGATTLMATRVVPDGLSAALGALGLLAFVRYLATGATAPLALGGAMIAAAALQKPLALQLGLVMFGWTVALAPQRLRDAKLWVVFAAVPALVAAWLLHAANLHEESGLTFGVCSGGDTKFPDAGHLVDPATYGGLAVASLQYGLSAFGAVALLALLLRRRFDRADAALLGAMAAGLLLSLRYSCSVGLGPHYHAFAAFVGAWFVARAWPRGAGRWPWLALLAAVAVHAGWRARYERGVRVVVNSDPLVVAARAVAPRLRGDDVLLARSVKRRYDVEWGRPQNCEDPRVFSLTGARGFVVAADEWDVATLADRRARGAGVVFDALPRETSPEVLLWLSHNATLLYDGPGARVHRLLPRAGEPLRRTAR